MDAESGTDHALAATGESGIFNLQPWLATWQNDYLFYRLDDQQRIQFISPSVRRILGYEPKEMLGCNYRDFMDLDHPLHAQLQDLSDRLLAGALTGLRRCVARRQDGSLAFLALRERPVADQRGRQIGVEAMAQDETARVNAELSLRQSERKYRRLVEGLKGGDYVIYSHTAEGVITYVSPSVREVLGFPVEEVVGKNWRDFIGPDNYGRAAADRSKRDVEGRKSLYKLVVEIRHHNGSPRLLEIQERPIFGFDGRYLAMEGIAKDVTEATRTAHELQALKEELEQRVAARTAELSDAICEMRRSEARYRNVVETQEEFITRWRPDGTRTFVNEAYCRYFQRTRDQLLGRNFLDFIVDAERETFLRSTESLTPAQSSIAYDQHVYRPDGSIGCIQWSDRAFFDADGRPIEYQSVGRDVTELRRAAEQLHEQELQLAHVSRLATMGELVAGIAHEVHQPLHAARTFAEAARRHLAIGKPESHAAAVECTREVEACISRTASIIRRMRNFTKSQPVKMERLDLNEVLVESLEAMAFETRRAKVRQVVALAPGLAPIEGDRIQLQQVFVNLLLNACEAMESTPVEERTLTISTTAEADGIDVAFRDAGPGIPHNARERVFDAFFTTKEGGMGMGLSLCRTIAAAHQARLRFESNAPEPGCTFHFFVPLALRRVS
ncbi:MAG: PAS domain S-box protein [Pirellulales bacterium]|nr:PAS domain S-box protein [Pirellulales bacterium]